MSVNLINGDGVQAVYAAQDADWYAGLTGETTCILPVNDKLASELVDSNTLQISSGVVVSKEGRRIQINEGDIEEVIIPTGAQGVTNYYIVGFREYIDEQGTQMAEPFIESVESATATITELTFKEGASEVYVSLYRLTQEGLVVTEISRICPYMSDMNEIADEIGDTDISSIGDGTLTGAIGQINSDLTEREVGSTYSLTATGCTLVNTSTYAHFIPTYIDKVNNKKIGIAIVQLSFTVTDTTVAISGLPKNASESFIVNFANEYGTVDKVFQMSGNGTSISRSSGVSVGQTFLGRCTYLATENM